MSFVLILTLLNLWYYFCCICNLFDHNLNGKKIISHIYFVCCFVCSRMLIVLICCFVFVFCVLCFVFYFDCDWTKKKNASQVLWTYVYNMNQKEIDDKCVVCFKRFDTLIFVFDIMLRFVWMFWLWMWMWMWMLTIFNCYVHISLLQINLLIMLKWTSRAREICVRREGEWQWLNIIKLIFEIKSWSRWYIISFEFWLTLDWKTEICLKSVKRHPTSILNPQ